MRRMDRMNFACRGMDRMHFACVEWTACVLHAENVPHAFCMRRHGLHAFGMRRMDRMRFACRGMDRMRFACGGMIAFILHTRSWVTLLKHIRDVSRSSRTV